MKFIFSFLFAFIFILPVSADNQCTNLTQDTNPTCTGTAGCVWEEGECSQCQSGTASAAGENTCTQCPSGFDSGWADQHKAHPRGASSCSDWICIDNYFPVDTDNDNTPDTCSLCDPNSKPEHAEFYNDNCDWSCIQGYYKDGDSCTQCPTGSNTTAPGATSISQCQCGPNYYLDSGQSACLSCPTNATSPAGSTSISQCQCNDGYYRGGANMDSCIRCTGTLSCSGTGLTYSNTSNPTGFSCSNNLQLVPDDTTHTYSCQSCSDSNAALDNGVCKCNQNYYGTIDGLNTQCTACPSNSTTAGTGSTSISACKCNKGYYDTESDTDSVSCTACPIGMTTVVLDDNNNNNNEPPYPTNTTTNGATSINQCAMTTNTKFCYSVSSTTNERQQICVNLIPSTATKINGRTISTGN